MKSGIVSSIIFSGKLRLFQVENFQVRERYAVGIASTYAFRAYFSGGWP
jgi:hypothetical protein